MIAMFMSYFESRLAKQHIKDVFVHRVLANTNIQVMQPHPRYQTPSPPGSVLMPLPIKLVPSFPKRQTLFSTLCHVEYCFLIFIEGFSLGLGDGSITEVLACKHEDPSSILRTNIILPPTGEMYACMQPQPWIGGDWWILKLAGRQALPA